MNFFFNWPKDFVNDIIFDISYDLFFKNVELDYFLLHVTQNHVGGFNQNPQNLIEKY